MYQLNHVWNNYMYETVIYWRQHPEVSRDESLRFEADTLKMFIFGL